MKKEYAEQVEIIRNNDPSMGGPNRGADATLQALIATDQASAAEALLAANQTAADSAKQQARRLMISTWVLASATVGLFIATLALVYKTGG